MVEFCCELGSMHKGNKSLAYEMIRQFSAVNPGGIMKFQLGHPVPPVKAYYGGLTVEHMRYAPMEWVEDLDKWCTQFGVEFMASIWSQEGLDAARSVNMRRYKMASRKAFASHTNIEYNKFLDKMLKDGKDIFVSDGVDAPGYVLR